MESQHELFDDLPKAVDPRGNFESFRLPDGKVIQVPKSVWKDGRKRFDLTEFGGRIIISRNPDIADQQAIEELRKICQSRDEIIREHDERAIEIVHKLTAQARPKTKKRRLRKKEVRSAPALYANPFIEDKTQYFGKYPDWLLARKDLNDHEKLVYGRLLFPLPPICKSWDKNLGVIIELDQKKLGEALGRCRTWVNEQLVALQAKGWIYCRGNWKQTIEFLWKEGMPEKCRTVRHFSGDESVAPRDRKLSDGPTETDDNCRTARQFSQGIEKRELEKREREERKSHSLGWGS